MSKVALNAITRVIADEFKAEPIIINSMCPGFVATGPIQTTLHKT
jgi:NAD(P)-dependent dehydrogenase (short-subunit alcohol dehydrogenase family)